MLGDLAKIRRKIRAIRARDTSLDRRELIRSYVRAQLGWLIGVKMLRRRRTSERVMGLRVSFDDYTAFASLFEEIFANEQYRVPLEAPAPRIIDAGANIGLATLYFKLRHPAAHVVAFEPDSRAAALLRRNVEGNGLGGVEVVEAALAAADGTVTLYSDVAASPLATTKPGAFRGGTEVRAVRLSSYLDEPADLVKLDVEGAEPDVLRELETGGALARVGALVFEYSHHHPDPDADSFGEVLSLLERNGFGYQLSAPYLPPLERGAPQNVLVSAWRKR